MIQKDIKVGSIKVYATIFNNIEEVVQYLNKAETSPLFRGRELSSQRVRVGASDFHETETFEEAKEYLEYRL